MKTSIKSGLNESDQKQVEKEFNVSHLLRSTYKQMINDQIEAAQSKMANEEAFDKPNWASRQAFLAGEIKALRRIYGLL